jgi:hypothetical protein
MRGDSSSVDLNHHRGLVPISLAAQRPTFHTGSGGRGCQASRSRQASQVRNVSPRPEFVPRTARILGRQKGQHHENHQRSIRYI